MELRHLRYFVAVAEELNFSRAAERLHVSQPPLSRQIRDLESELNVKLLDRDRTKVRVTTVGKKLLVQAKRLVQEAESLLQSARAINGGEAKEINIGCTPLPTALIVSGVLARFQTVSPNCRVNLHDLTHLEILSALKAKKLNAALTLRPASSEMRGFNFETLSRYPVGIVCSKTSPIAQQKRVHPSVILRNQLVVCRANEFPEYDRWLSKVLRLSPKNLAVSLECNDVLGVIAGVESGCGVAIAGQFITAILGDRVRFVPFGPKAYFLDVGMLYRKSDYIESIKKVIATSPADQING